MILRGITFDKHIITFDINDGPALVSDDIIALTNRPNSPLLWANSIARGDEVTGVFENDFIFSEKQQLIGHVIYNNGFFIKRYMEDECIPMESKYHRLENANCEITKILEAYKQPIRYKTGNFAFTLKRVLRVEGNNLIITNKLLKPINLNNVKMCCGLIGTDGNELAYGDFFGGGIVECHNFKPMIKMADGSYRDFRKEELQWEQVDM